MAMAGRETLELLSDVVRCAIGLEGADCAEVHEELYSEGGILDQAVELLAAAQRVGALAMPQRDTDHHPATSDQGEVRAVTETTVPTLGADGETWHHEGVLHSNEEVPEC